jgi:hypothetical protein
VAPVNPPAWQQAGSYPARLDRLTIAGLLTPAASVGPITARSGVRPNATGSAMGVIQRTPADMFVTVNPGVCFIGAASAVGGAYECHNDATYDVLLASANATLPRKDLVVARIYDAFDDVGSRNEYAIEAITGTPNSAPVVPATPAGALALAQVTVPAAATAIATANIADVRQYTTGLGGLLPVVSQADRDALSAYGGLAVWRADAAPQRMEAWDSVRAAWTPVSPAYPSVAVHREGGLSLTGTSPTPIPWDRDDWQDNVAANAMHNTASNQTRLVAPMAGKYTVTSAVQFANNVSAPFMTIALNVNGTQTRVALAGGTANKTNGIFISAPLKLNANDYVEVVASSTVSGHTITAGITTTYAMMALSSL